MIDNINNGACQTCRLRDAKENIGYTIQAGYSFSFSAGMAIQNDTVSIGDSGEISSLDRFDHHLRKQLHGMLNQGRKPHSFGAYPESGSPAGFAGRLLRNIRAEFAGIAAGATGTSPENSAQVDMDTTEAAVVEESNLEETIEDINTAAAAATETAVEVPETETASSPAVSESEAEKTSTPAASETAKSVPEAKKNITNVKEGIEKGYQNTVKELTTENASQNDMDSVDDAYTLILKGLEDIQQRLITDRDLTIGTGAAESNALSLEILTRDGDVVTIEINHDMGIGESLAGSRGQRHGTSYEQIKYLSESLNFSINGNIDEDEHAAISELIGNIASLADTFFNGDMEEAMEMAYALNLDTSELQEFNLDMSSRQTGYIQYIPKENMSEGHRVNAGMLEYAKQYAQQFKNSYAFGILQQPEQAVPAIFKAISNQMESAASEMIEKMTELLETFLTGA